MRGERERRKYGERYHSTGSTIERPWVGWWVRRERECRDTCDGSGGTCDFGRRVREGACWKVGNLGGFAL